MSVIPGLGGPVVALGPLRVGEWIRERVLGLSAVWPSGCASVSSASRPCGRRVLAVWPLESGRVASGFSPRGVASFYTLGRGLRTTRVEWSSIYPVPAPLPVPDPQQCPTCPHPAGLRLPSWRASWCSLSAGGAELRVTAASGANATCGQRIRWGWVRGVDYRTGSGSSSHPCPRAPRT